MKTLITIIALFVFTQLNAQTTYTSCWESNENKYIYNGNMTSDKGYSCFCWNEKSIAFYIDGIGLQTIIVDNIIYPTSDQNYYQMHGKMDERDVSVILRLKEDFQVAVTNGATYVIDKIKYVNSTPSVITQ